MNKNDLFAELKCAYKKICFKVTLFFLFFFRFSFIDFYGHCLPDGDDVSGDLGNIVQKVAWLLDGAKR